MCRIRCEVVLFAQSIVELHVPRAQVRFPYGCRRANWNKWWLSGEACLHAVQNSSTNPDTSVFLCGHLSQWSPLGPVPKPRLASPRLPGQSALEHQYTSLWRRWQRAQPYWFVAWIIRKVKIAKCLLVWFQVDAHTHTHTLRSFLATQPTCGNYLLHGVAMRYVLTDGIFFVYITFQLFINIYIRLMVAFGLNLYMSIHINWNQRGDLALIYSTRCNSQQSLQCSLCQHETH